MSAYIHFFIRGGNQFYPIGTFCRSSEIYQICMENGFGYVWEQITPITKEKLTYIDKAIANRLKETDENINDYEDMIASIAKMDNSIEEKMSAIMNSKETIADFKETKEEILQAQGFINTLFDILEEAEDTKYDDDESRHIDANKYLYVGIECAYPTVDDIIGE